MTLKNVMLLNATSSGLVGFLLVLFPHYFSSLFKIDIITPFIEVGVFLILFSVLVLVTALQKPIKKHWAKLIIKIDLTWVVASLIISLILLPTISSVGTIIILAIAAWVGVMAFLQNKYLIITK